MSDDTFANEPGNITSGPSDGSESHRVACDGGSDAGEGKIQLIEAIFRSLSAQRRRYVLYELRANEMCNLETLTTTVAAQTRDVPLDAVDPEDVESTRAQLLHADIPLLADAGFVEYDPRSETLRYSDPPPLLDTFLQLCVDIDTPSTSQ